MFAINRHLIMNIGVIMKGKISLIITLLAASLPCFVIFLMLNNMLSFVSLTGRLFIFAFISMVLNFTLLMKIISLGYIEVYDKG